jgi:hypothetical protein
MVGVDVEAICRWFGCCQYVLVVHSLWLSDSHCIAFPGIFVSEKFSQWCVAFPNIVLESP